MVQQEAAERLQRGDLAGDGRGRVGALAQPGDVAGDQLAVDAAGGEFGVAAVLFAGEADEAAEVVAVGVDGVSGCSALGGHVVQERLDSVVHRRSRVLSPSSAGPQRNRGRAAVGSRQYTEPRIAVRVPMAADTC